MFQYPATVSRVVDGDTLWLDVDLGFRTHVQVDVRLARINAPEVVEFTAQGIEDRSRMFIEMVLPPGSMCVANITKPDKYGRWLADVIYLQGVSDRERIAREGKSLNDELLTRGLAKPY